MAKQNNSLDHIRHSLAHILGMAVLEKFPKAKLGVGPVIENGFYYDFDLPQSLTPDDLAGIEKSMREILKKHLDFSGKKVTPAVAKKIFKDQPFKLDLIKEFIKEKKTLTTYEVGNAENNEGRKASVISHESSAINFVDLCRGGHVENTSEIDPHGFRLDRIAGAYWRGDEKNPQLTRIYGLAFETEKELEAYLAMRAEAEKRDHRKIGREQELFCFDDLVGKGLPLWLPKGTIIKDEVENFAKEMETKYGYERVSTPHLGKKELYLTSGHLPYYEDSMYPAMKIDDGTYYVKAMNCPHHHVIYRSRPRSYKELPIRLAEYGTVYRNELSGTLAGLLRVRSLEMNDAHIYCRKDQIAEEVRRVIELTRHYFKTFGLTDYWFRLSKWDPKNTGKYIREPKHWEFTEEILRNILNEAEVKFVEAEDEAAFYGPKIDVQFKSIIGREETMSTIQLDFAAKERFKLAYVDNNGKENDEVFVIHRAPLSTHERFMAFLIEHYAGVFPLWLAPEQVRILPVSEKFLGYAEKVRDMLTTDRVRVAISEANETLGKRIREAQLMKVPYVLVVGEKEVAQGTVSVRHVSRGDEGMMAISDFREKVQTEITHKT